MVKIEKRSSQLKISIPISGMEELHTYQKGLLGILVKIETCEYDPDLMENLRAVHTLLAHLLLDKDFHAQHKEIVKKHRGIWTGC
jgi:hypothetical protein